MKLNPIILFAYNRPEHLHFCLESLKRCSEFENSELYVFVDGPKNAEDAFRVTAVRQILSRNHGLRCVHLHFRESNLGLATSIISGLNEVLSDHEAAIVVEDDLVVSPQFLTFMNAALNYYADEDRVACVSGYVYPAKDLPAAFFIRGADCWGWGTWRRAWSLFSSDGTELLEKIQRQGLAKSFDFGGTYPFLRLLRRQVAGQTDSWAIRWYASCFLKDKLCLYPGTSFVSNIGLDGSGNSKSFDFLPYQVNALSYSIPDFLSLKVEHSSESALSFARHFLKSKGGWLRRLVGKVQFIKRQVLGC